MAVRGERIPGGFILITGIDGIRYAVRQQSVAIVHDADECRDENLVQLHGGHVVRPSLSRRLGRFVETGPIEEHDALPVSEFHGGVDGAEGELAAAILAKAHIGRLDQIEVVAIPQIRLDDPPPADQFTARGGAHVAAAISFGARTRL
jgi:hypothetical protein